MTQIFNERSEIKTDDGLLVSVQNPFPTDGDSIYAKDIDSVHSSVGTFSGDALNLFNDYETEIIDISSTDPKTITLFFKRPVKSNGISIGSSTGNFSNVKIQLKDLSGTVRTVVDDSLNNTKYTSNVYSFVSNVFISATIEFHTVDAVKINGMYIPKIQSRTISSIDGYISDTNSSGTPLLADAVFTGTQVDTLNFGMVLISVYSDVSSAINGLSIQFRSTENGAWRESDRYTIDANSEKTFSIQTVRRFMRVVYTNGASNQSVFDLQTTIKPVYIKPSSHRISDVISYEDDAELVKSVITGARNDGVFGNCILDNGNNLRINSFPYTYSIAEELISGHTALLKFGTRTLVAANTQSLIWEGTNALYTYLTSAEKLKVSSSSANDTALGTGARTLTLIGLDGAWNELTETISMNGVTPVETSGSFIRIFRSFVATSGTSYINEGKITITNNAGTNELLVISATDGQTLMALWTVPLGYEAFMVSGTISTDTNKGARVSFFTRLNDGGILYPWQIKYRAYVFGGNNIFPFTIPFKIPAKTDIEVRVITPAAAGTTSAGATFELWYELA